MRTRDVLHIGVLTCLDDGNARLVIFAELDVYTTIGEAFPSIEEREGLGSHGVVCCHNFTLWDRE